MWGGAGAPESNAPKLTLFLALLLDVPFGGVDLDVPFGGVDLFKVVRDRSSAHFAAWHSPKRDAADVGQHFKLNDARNWLRLMFWSARDVGLMENEFFADWYQRCK